jgi:hypothetical protein
MKKQITKYIDAGIEVVLEEKYEDDLNPKPIKISINKNIHDSIPGSEFIRKLIMDKLGFAVSYNEYYDSTVNYWETKISSCISAKNKKR